LADEEDTTKLSPSHAMNNALQSQTRHFRPRRLRQTAMQWQSGSTP